uniref:Ig-like domain-containing protein n=1 Tax=Hucho hucho TaxID=62062 RepID=A0A4W5JXD6_9TELE
GWMGTAMRGWEVLGPAVTGLVGDPVSLPCEGVPVPLLSWVLPDRSILIPDLNSHGPHPRVSIFPNGTLRIVAVGPADRGLYRCVASNPAGASSLSVRLHVSFLPPAIQQPREERVTQVMIKVLTSPPSFPRTRYEVIKVQQGGVVALNCGAKGQP